MSGMSSKYPRFTEKLNMLLARKGPQSQVAAELSELLGDGHQIAQSTVANYAKGAIPKPHVTEAMARYFGVDLTDLICEDVPAPKRVEDFRPPHSAAIESLSDHDLYMTSARRFAAQILRWCELINAMRNLDWPKLNLLAWESEILEPLPDEIADEVKLVDEAIYLNIKINASPNLYSFCEKHADELPGAELGPDRFKKTRTHAAEQTLVETPGYKMFGEFCVRRRVLAKASEEDAIAMLADTETKRSVARAIVNG